MAGLLLCLGKLDWYGMFTLIKNGTHVHCCKGLSMFNFVNINITHLAIERKSS